jgi:hypothetical protein
LSRVLKECFGSVISSLAKMRECTRCELLAECRAMNWTEPTDGESAAAGDDRPPERDALDSGSPDKSRPAGS